MKAILLLEMNPSLNNINKGSVIFVSNLNWTNFKQNTYVSW